MSKVNQYNRNRSPAKPLPKKIGYNDKAKTVKPSALPKPVYKSGGAYNKKTYDYDDSTDSYRGYGSTRRARSADPPYAHTHKKYDYDSGRGSSPDHHRRKKTEPSYARMTVARQNKLAQQQSLHSNHPSRNNSQYNLRSSNHPSRHNSQHNLHSHHPSRNNSPLRSNHPSRSNSQQRTRRYSDSSDDDLPVGGRRYSRNNRRDSSSDSDSVKSYKKPVGKQTYKYSRTNSSSDDDSIKGSAYRRINNSKYSRNQSPPSSYNRRNNHPQLRRTASEDSLAYTQRISRFNKGYHGDTWTTANQEYGKAKNNGRKPLGTFDDARYRTNGKMTKVHH